MVSTAEGDSAMSANPAGLARSDAFSLSGSQILGLLGAQVSQLTLATKLGRSMGLGLQGAALYDSDTARDGYGNETGSFNNLAWTAGLGLGLSVTRDWSLGATARALQENWAGQSAGAFAFDLGVQGRVWRELRAGLGAFNLGSGFGAGSGVPLPTRIQGGLSVPVFVSNWRFNLELAGYPDSRQLRLLSATEISAELEDQDSAASKALPWKVWLRLGYASPLLFGETGKLGLGAGLDMPPLLGLDYAVQFLGDFGPAHRVALSLRFPAPTLPIPQGAELSAPYNLTARPSLDGVVLWWEDSNPKVAGYHIYADYGVLVDKLTSKPTRDNFQKFIKVEKGRQYNFYVRAVGGDGKESQASETLQWRAP